MLGKKGDDESIKYSMYQRAINYFGERLKLNLIEAIDEKWPSMVSMVNTEAKDLIDSRWPFIKDGLLQDVEKLLDRKISLIDSIIKKIALILFVCFIPLSLGIWALAIALFIR